MEKQKNKDQLEILAIAIVLFFIFKLLYGSYLSALVFRDFSLDWYKNDPAGVAAISIVRSVFSSSINIAIAIWLFHSARKSGAKQWIWATLGYFFGFSAVILYFMREHLFRNST